MADYQERFLIGYLNNCGNWPLLNNREGLRRLVRTAAKKANATIIRAHTTKYPGQGITASADIGESVFLIQGWPERHYGLVILHSSYSSLDLEEGMNYIKKRLKPDNPRFQKIKGPELPPPAIE